MSSFAAEVYPSHLLAQRLNNRGAYYFETGEYDKAIAHLIKALKTWESVARDEAGCECSSCSLDECIMRNRQESAYDGYRSMTKGVSFVDDSCDQEERFIYRRPIYAPDSFADANHTPGVTLSLIIILNLAMAHHVSAIEKQLCRKSLQKALQLYELAHQLQLEEYICSPRATMIIANNVGEIHRAVENRSKHNMCLQHLLSTMMYMIDNGIPTVSLEFEGFFRNTTQLILHDHCAGAA